MNVLITGSEGVLGVHLCRVLGQRGPRAIGYNLARGFDNLDPSQLTAALRGVDACVHLAAVADLYVAEDQPAACERVNVLGTLRVLEASDTSGMRLDRRGRAAGSEPSTTRVEPVQSVIGSLSSPRLEPECLRTT